MVLKKIIEICSENQVFCEVVLFHLFIGGLEGGGNE